jgi:hypothetical protein
MKNERATYRPVAKRKPTALRYALIALIIEKIIQHAFVTIAFYSNWGDIRSTVALDPGLLMVLGGIVALLFALSLWAMLARREWATNLVLALALFDIIGEFTAQGRAAIAITVSFVVAIALLFLTLTYRRQ